MAKKQPPIKQTKLHTRPQNPTQATIDMNKEAWLLRKKNPQKALKLAKKAHVLSEQNRDDAQIAASKSIIAEALFWLSEYEEGLIYAEKALQLFKKSEDDHGKAVCYNTMGNIYHRLSNCDLALEFHLKSLDLRRKLSDQSEEGYSLNNIGNIYLEIGDYASALDYYIKSLRISQDMKDARGEAGCFNNIGNVYQRLEEYENALDYYHKCLSLIQQGQDKNIETSCMNNLGSLYHLNKDYEKALSYFFNSLEITRQLHDKWGEGLLMVNIGNVYLSLEEDGKARQYFMDSLSLSQTIGDLEGQIEALLGLGKLHLKEREGTEALPFLNQAFELANNSSYQETLYRIHESLTQAYEETKETDLALIHCKKFVTLKDEFFQNEVNKKTRVLKIRYESEQAQNEKEIYRLKNEELAVAYERLRGLNISLREANEQKSQLLEQLRVQTQALEKQTREDSLTGLNNRRYLDFLLSQEFERSKRYNSALSVAIADIDHFKRVNDNYSHQIGDEVLKKVADIFKHNSRVIDTISRYGGEEFVFFFPETPLEKAVLACEKIRNAIENHDWEYIHKGLRVTISIGITSDMSVQTHEKMISLADNKLYEAKQKGRNQIRY